MADIFCSSAKEENQVKDVVSDMDLQSFTTSTEGEKTIARLLGKSEEGLKSEFYLFKVKELMKRVGLRVQSALSQKDLEQKISASKKVGVEEIFLTPFYHSVVRLLKPSDLKGIKICIAVDYPLGEQSLRQKVIGVKEGCKNQADYIFCSVAQGSVKLSCFGEEKRKILKSRRACKKPFGIIINALTELDDVQKILKNTEGLRLDSIVIDGTDASENQTIQALTTANTFKGKRKLHVLSSVQTAFELSALVDAGADKVYTPFAFNVGQELIAKAQITI